MDLPDFPPLITDNPVSNSSRFNSKNTLSRKEAYRALTPLQPDSTIRVQGGGSSVPDDTTSTLEIDCSNSNIEVRFLPSPSSSVTSHTRKLLSPCALQQLQESQSKLRKPTNPALSTLQRYHGVPTATIDRCQPVAEYVFLRDIGVSPSSTTLMHSTGCNSPAGDILSHHHPTIAELPYEQPSYNQHYQQQTQRSPTHTSNAYRTFYQPTHSQTRHPNQPYSSRFNRLNQCVSPLVVTDRCDPLNNINITVNMNNSCKHMFPQRSETPPPGTNGDNASSRGFRRVQESNLYKSESFDDSRKITAFRNYRNCAKEEGTTTCNGLMTYSSYTSYSLPSLNSVKQESPLFERRPSYKTKPHPYKSVDYISSNLEVLSQKKSVPAPDLSLGLEERITTYTALEIQGKTHRVYVILIRKMD